MTNKQNSRNAPRSGKFIEIWLRDRKSLPISKLVANSYEMGQSALGVVKFSEFN